MHFCARCVASRSLVVENDVRFKSVCELQRARGRALILRISLMHACAARSYIGFQMQGVSGTEARCAACCMMNHPCPRARVCVFVSSHLDYVPRRHTGRKSRPLLSCRNVSGRL